MRLWLSAVGRAKAGPARDLFEEYRGRLSWPLTLKEVEVRKRVYNPAAAARFGIEAPDTYEAIE